MDEKRKLQPKQKMFFADNLTRAVDLVRIARREVEQLNNKADPEKELYCYSSILKADAMIERCSNFMEKYQDQLIIKTLEKTNMQKIFEITERLMNPEGKLTPKLKQKDIFKHLKDLALIPNDWTFVAYQKWYQRAKKKMGN